MTVIVSFKYEPDTPDINHESGMSEEDYLQVTDAVTSLGGFDIEIEKDGE